jgi:hypothetical protein
VNKGGPDDVDDSDMSVEPLVRRTADDDETFYPPLDAGIAEYVRVLRAGGVETYESCDGTAGHACPEPTVFFNGEPSAGWLAMHVAQENGLPVLALRRVWTVILGEPTGPCWEMTFRPARAS